MNATCSKFLKIFRVGENSDQLERHRTNYVNKSANLSAMKLLLKDHKGLEKISTRRTNGPGINIHLSNLLADIIEPVVDYMPQSWEHRSTESTINW